MTETMTKVEAGYADRYDPDTHFDHWYTDATATLISGHIGPGDHVLELGSATGRMTEVLCAAGAQVTGIEHSAAYIARAQDRQLATATFHQADIADWLADAVAPPGGFKHVVATNILHELEDLDAVMAACRRLGGPRSMMHVSLQNPSSVHRLTGRALGLIDDLAAVTDKGRSLNTLEIHDSPRLESALNAAGYDVVSRHGVMLKPFPNHEMSQLSDRQILGLIAVGSDFPDHCAINYLAARTP